MPHILLRDFIWPICFFMAAVLSGSCNCNRGAGPVEGDGKSQLQIADPFILNYQGRYYAYGTGEDGFRVYVSDDLVDWTAKGIALDLDNCWGTKWFWAPEVYYIESRDLFYMFYSAEEHICVATSTSPEGPFVQDEMEPIREEQGIDASLFIDRDGKAYLYFVRFTDGNVIWVAEMNDDLKSLKEETLTKCLSAEEPWETIMGKVAEGPSVFKDGETYYLLYSANDYQSQDYAVGYATASSPLGPWTKYEGNPIFSKGFPNAGNLIGIGHGAPLKTTDGKLMYVFHAHDCDTLIHPRRTYVNSELEIAPDGTLSMPGKVVVPQLQD